MLKKAVHIYIILLIFFCLSLGQLLSAEEKEVPIVQYKSSHYKMNTDLDERYAKECLKVLEEFHDAARKLYRKSPKKDLLTVNFISTKEKLNKYMASHGGGSVNMGGIYIYDGSITATMIFHRSGRRSA